MNTPHTPVTSTRGPWWVAYGQVFAGNGIDSQISILKADRDEPRTSPVERDRNIELAALAPTLLAQRDALKVAVAIAVEFMPHTSTASDRMAMLQKFWASVEALARTEGV